MHYRLVNSLHPFAWPQLLGHYHRQLLVPRSMPLAGNRIFSYGYLHQAQAPQQSGHFHECFLRAGNFDHLRLVYTARLRCLERRLRCL